MDHNLEYLIIEYRKNYEPFFRILIDLGIHFTHIEGDITYKEKYPDGGRGIESKHIELTFESAEDRILAQLMLNNYKEYIEVGWYKRNHVKEH